MTAAMTEAMVTMTAPTVPVIIPAEQRQQLLRLCREVPDGSFCTRVAELSWEAGDPQQAVQALAAACTSGNDTATCERLPALQAVGASLQPQPATVLPCGDYRSDGGLMDTLDFGDDGLVGVGWNSHLRARVEEGDIRIRHDRGGDFVLRPLPGGQLLGLDTWTRFQVFTPPARVPPGAAHPSSTRYCRCHRTAHWRWPTRTAPTPAVRRASCRAATYSATGWRCPGTGCRPQSTTPRSAAPASAKGARTWSPRRAMGRTWMHAPSWGNCARPTAAACMWPAMCSEPRTGS